MKKTISTITIHKLMSNFFKIGIYLKDISSLDCYSGSVKIIPPNFETLKDIKLEKCETESTCFVSIIFGRIYNNKIIMFLF
jgi:hypothetical protein